MMNCPKKIGLIGSGYRLRYVVDYLLKAAEGKIEVEIESFSVESQLIPLTNSYGFKVEAVFKNRGANPLHLKLVPLVEGNSVDRVEMKDWVFTPPPKNSGEMRMTIDAPKCASVVNPGESVRMEVYGQMHEPGSGVNRLEVGGDRDLGAASERCWEERIGNAMSGFPTIATNHEGLNGYIKRCLITGLTCLWESPVFLLKRHLATAGLDGGGICTYLWDLSYAPKVIHLLMPDILPLAIEAFQNVDLSQYFAMTPDGQGSGSWYAANEAALTDLIWDLAVFEGPSAKNTRWLRGMFQVTRDRLPLDGHLLDYGNNRNLLEMRTNGYEHFVPCMNGLRAYNLRRLADLCAMANLPGGSAYRKEADGIESEIQSRLWNEKEMWFDCLDRSGKRHHVDSIQVFDVILSGVATASQRIALVKRLKDNDFLARYGVHSVSPRDDLHYESIDIDWSGNGAFIGEPPILACMLWQNGHADVAWDILQRLFWMGSQLPYLPQETHAQKPLAGKRGRSNNVAALAGVHAVLFGMLGIELSPQGGATIRPQLPEKMELELENFQYRNKKISIKADSRHCEVFIDGKPVPDPGCLPFALFRS